MLKSKINLPLFLIIFISLSCNRNKNKPYQNVEVLKSEKQVKIIPELITFPQNFEGVSQLYAEIDHSDISVEAWDKDSIQLDYSGEAKNKLDIDVHNGNGQIVLKEKLKLTRPEESGKWICRVPENFGVIIKSQKGSVSLNGLKGTFEISSPVSKVQISNCESSMKVILQSGSIDVDGWKQRGRTKLSSASGSVKVNSKSDISYALDMHSGSDTVSLMLNGNQLNTNVEALRFKGQGELISNFDFGPIEPFYSDALEVYYDNQKINNNKNSPPLSISTGNGVIILNK
jgi:hypothetical protein